MTEKYRWVKWHTRWSWGEGKPSFSEIPPGCETEEYLYILAEGQGNVDGEH